MIKRASRTIANTNFGAILPTHTLEYWLYFLCTIPKSEAMAKASGSAP